MEINLAYSFTRQRRRQFYLSFCFSLCCCSNIIDNFLFGGDEILDTVIFTLSLGGVLASILAVVGVLFHVRSFIHGYMFYIFGTTQFCVVYHVFQMGSHGATYSLVFLVISGLLIVLGWTQLYQAMYFLRLLTLYDVYHSHPLGEVEQVPREDLVALLERLDQKPKWSQIVELLSLIPYDYFTFDEFCQIEAKLEKIEAAARVQRRRSDRNTRRSLDTSFVGARDALLQETPSDPWPQTLPSPPQVPGPSAPVVRFTIAPEEFWGGAVVGGRASDFPHRGAPITMGDKEKPEVHREADN